MTGETGQECATRQHRLNGKELMVWRWSWKLRHLAAA